MRSSVIGSNLAFGSSVVVIADGASSPKRSREAKPTTLANGTMIENSVVDGIFYKCAVSIGGYLVEIDLASEPTVKISDAEAKSTVTPDVLGLPNGVRVQESILCGKMYEDAIVKDGSFVEIAELPDDESKGAAEAAPVGICESAIGAGNFFVGEWSDGRVVTRSHVIGKNNSIHASMTGCYVAGDDNSFTFSIEEVYVIGSSNKINTPLRSCRIGGSRNVLNAGFVKSHVRGSNNTFEKGMENSYVTGSENEFRGKVVNCNVTGDKNKFAGDMIGSTIETSETEIGY